MIIILGPRATGSSGAAARGRFASWTIPSKLSSIAHPCGSSYLGSITLSAAPPFFLLGVRKRVAAALPSLLPVKGKVTYKGQPLTKGTIRFEPDYGRMATGKIQSDGTFVLSTLSQDDGVVAGFHKVSISDTGPTSKKELVPKKYLQPGTSKLTAEVDAEHTEFTFDLVDGK